MENRHKTQSFYGITYIAIFPYRLCGTKNIMSELFSQHAVEPEETCEMVEAQVQSKLFRGKAMIRS